MSLADSMLAGHSILAPANLEHLVLEAIVALALLNLGLALTLTAVLFAAGFRLRRHGLLPPPRARRLWAAMATANAVFIAVWNALLIVLFIYAGGWRAWWMIAALCAGWASGLSAACGLVRMARTPGLIEGKMGTPGQERAGRRLRSIGVSIALSSAPVLVLVIVLAQLSDAALRTPR